MDLMDYITCMARLDEEANVLFARGGLFVVSRDEKNQSFMHFTMERKDFLAINGSIFGQVKNVKLVDFVFTGGMNARNITMNFDADFDMRGQYIEIASALQKVLEQSGKRANLNIILNGDCHDPINPLDLRDVSAKNLAAEVCDYMFSLYDSKELISGIPLQYISVNVPTDSGVNVPADSNAQITIKEVFMG